MKDIKGKIFYGADERRISKTVYRLQQPYFIFLLCVTKEETCQCNTRNNRKF
jgi:hypothetical protein